MRLVKQCKFILISFVFLITVSGYIATFSIYSQSPIAYLLFTVLLLISYTVLIPSLFVDLKKSLPVWIIFTVLVAFYVVKFYILSFDYDIGEYGSLLAASLDETKKITIFQNISLSFIIFAITTLLVFSYTPRPAKLRPGETRIIVSNKKSYLIIIKFLLLLVLIMMIFISYLIVKNQLVMGMQKEKLPFKLEGIIVFINIIVIPILLLSAMWFSNIYHSRRYFLLSIALYFIYAIADMLTRGSKGSIFSMLTLLLIFFWRAGYKLTVYRVLIGFLLLLMMFFSYPVMEVIRTLKHAGVPIYDFFSHYHNYMQDFSVIEVLKMGMVRGFMRFTGCDAFAVFIANNAEPIGLLNYAVLLSNEVRGVGKYVAEFVFFVRAESVDVYGPAPSLLGNLYIIGGSIAIVIGTFIITMVSLKTWMYFGRSKLLTAPIIQIYIIPTIMSIYTEGTFERTIFHVLPFVLITAIFVECMFRKTLVDKLALQRNLATLAPHNVY